MIAEFNNIKKHSLYSELSHEDLGCFFVFKIIVMIYVYLILSAVSYCFFAYDLENHRDMFTWLHLGISIFWFYQFHSRKIEDRIKK